MRTSHELKVQKASTKLSFDAGRDMQYKCFTQENGAEPGFCICPHRRRHSTNEDGLRAGLLSLMPLGLVAMHATRMRDRSVSLATSLLPSA